MAKISTLSPGEAVPTASLRTYIPFCKGVSESGTTLPEHAIMFQSLLLAAVEERILLRVDGLVETVAILKLVEDILSSSVNTQDFSTVPSQLFSVSSYIWHYEYFGTNVKVEFYPTAGEIDAQVSVPVETLSTQAETYGDVYDMHREMALRSVAANVLLGIDADDYYADVCRKARPDITPAGFEALIKKYGEDNWHPAVDENSHADEWRYVCYAVSGYPFIIAKRPGQSWEMRNSEDEPCDLTADFHWELAALYRKAMSDNNSNIILS